MCLKHYRPLQNILGIFITVMSIFTTFGTCNAVTWKSVTKHYDMKNNNCGAVQNYV
jgi:hypothetical protein